MKKIAIALAGVLSFSMMNPALSAAEESAQAAEQQVRELDRIVAVVNSDVITESELQQRVHTVALNLRRQQIDLPPMDELRRQVLERLITERAISQRAKQTGIRVDDQMVNASIEQIARQNNVTVEELRQKLAADGVAFSSFRNEIRDEITTQRLREREVDEKIVVLDSEIDAFLAEQQENALNSPYEYHLNHILIPFGKDASEADAEKLARDILARAKSGENFEQMVAAYSRADDALSGGNLGWRKKEAIPLEFWSAMQDNPVEGEVYIVESKAAWHVFKVSGKRKAQNPLLAQPVEQTHARHILMFVSELTPEATVIRRLNEIKTKIESGESDFATMARLNSVDTSATRGGDLGWLQAGDTVPEFEAAMNKLKVGEVSDPIKTNYGYHLIQVVDRKVDKDGNPQRQRVLARQALRQKKLGEAAYNWQRELRDEAYVEIRSGALE